MRADSCFPDLVIFQDVAVHGKDTHSCAVPKLHTWVLSELTILGCYLGSDGHRVPWAASVPLSELSTPLVSELSTPLSNLVFTQET